MDGNFRGNQNTFLLPLAGLLGIGGGIGHLVGGRTAVRPYNRLRNITAGTD